MQSKSGKKQSDRFTLYLSLAGILLTLVVYFFYTSGKVSSRDTARQNLSAQEEILSKEQAAAAKFLQGGTEVDRYKQAVIFADGYIPYQAGADPAADLILLMPSIVQNAAQTSGVTLEGIAAPTKLDQVAGVSAGVGALELDLGLTASVEQLNTLVTNISKSGKVFATVTAIAFTAQAPAGEDQQADLRTAAAITMSVKLRLWYTTTPALSQAPAPAEPASPAEPAAPGDTTTSTPQTPPSSTP